MNREEQIKMWEEAAKGKEREMGPHGKAMSNIIGGARQAGRKLTSSEQEALARHRQNAWNAEKKK